MNHDLCGNLLYIGYNMGGEQHQTVLCIGGDDIAELDPLIGIKAGAGFVQNQNLRVVQKGLRNAQPALHPAGIGGTFPFQIVPQTHTAAQFLDPLFCAGLIHTFQRR